MSERFDPIVEGRETGLLDCDGSMIRDGDMVSLGGNVTADDSTGVLPNGWTFDESDVYQVRFDHTISQWSLDLGCEPDSAYNAKYMNHATSLLHGESAKLVNNE